MPNSTQKFLISGAGIAGLALARRFEKLNIQYTLIEKRSELTPEGVGICLPANGVNALRHLELYDEVMARAHRVKTMTYAKPSGNILSRVSLSESPLNREAFIALHRHQLHEVLQAGVKNKIHLNSSINNMKEIDDGIIVDFNSSTLSQEKFSAVIGADGANSLVRKLAFGEIPLVDLGLSTWRWTCRYPTHDLQPTFLLGPQDLFMAYPIGPNEMYCYAHIYDPDNRFLKEGNDHQEFLNQHFRNYRGIAQQLLPLIPDTQKIIPGRLRSVPYPFFTKGRVALVGDAGKACSPLLQQGAACAFEDVVVLSEMLSNFDITDAFVHYQDYRKERVSWIVKTSDTPLKSISMMNSVFNQFVRDSVIRCKGPLNVQGWRKLFSTDPLAELPAFIKTNKATPIACR